MSPKHADPVDSAKVAARTKSSNYPEPFARRMNGRVKRQLGDHFGITKFGVNLTELNPGSQSALLHRHSVQEEFVYILQGCPTLITEDKEFDLKPGMCIGFPSESTAHHLINRTEDVVVILEVGDRESGDEVEYPKDDLVAERRDETWFFLYKDGRPY